MQLATRILIFAAGLATGAAGLYVSLRAEGVLPPQIARAASPVPVTLPPAPPPEPHDDFHVLVRRDLLIPVARVKADNLEDTFSHPRAGRKSHEAIDIPAPRGTPILAADNGVIRKLSVSVRGGISIYQFDPAEEYCYFYAHLDRYANHLKEGMRVRRGDVIGYVGTTGDAPANGPHLHFAIARLADGKNWWEGAPINPFPILSPAARTELGP